MLISLLKITFLVSFSLGAACQPCPQRRTGEEVRCNVFVIVGGVVLLLDTHLDFQWSVLQLINDTRSTLSCLMCLLALLFLQLSGEVYTFIFLEA